MKSSSTQKIKSANIFAEKHMLVDFEVQNFKVLFQRKWQFFVQHIWKFNFSLTDTSFC